MITALARQRFCRASFFYFPDKTEEEAAPVDLLADLIPQKKKPRPETYGFYLDSDVHDELVKLAKANKTNKSRYLNALLRRVFFGE